MTKKDRSSLAMPLALALCVAACGSPPEPRAPTSEDASPSLSSRTPSPDRSPAKYRVSASPPEAGEWTIALLIETCHGSCEEWTPAADLPVYTCRAAERGGVWSCYDEHNSPALRRIGISDAQGRVRTKSPIGSPARSKNQEVWKVFVPKTPASPVYRTAENESVYLTLPEPHRCPKFEGRQPTFDCTPRYVEDADRRAWREVRDGLVEVPELRFDTAFVAQVREVDDASSATQRVHEGRVVDGYYKSMVAQCRSTPTEAECAEMIDLVRKHGTAPELRAEAEAVYSQVQPILDTSSWNAASPSCRAPTNSGSCDAVKAYLSRYPSGLHAAEARQALSRAAPTLERLAHAEAAGEAEQRRERDAERQRVKEICLGQCRAAGTAEHDCWRRCDR